jgi:hypothetical protein
MAGNVAACCTAEVSPDAVGRDADRKRLHDTTMLTKDFLLATKKPASLCLRALRLFVQILIIISGTWRNMFYYRKSV